MNQKKYASMRQLQILILSGMEKFVQNIHMITTTLRSTKTKFIAVKS